MEEAFGFSANHLKEQLPVRVPIRIGNDYAPSGIGTGAVRTMRGLAQLDVLEQRLRQNKQAAAKAPRGEQDLSMADVNATADEIANFKLVTAPRLLADDATPEAMTKLLSEQGGVMTIMSTEGGIFEILAGRYSGTINIDAFLKAHTGDPIIVDRISRPPLYIPSPRLTMVLTVQPSVIKDLADKPGFRGRGLLARCWFSVPNSMVGYRVRKRP